MSRYRNEILETMDALAQGMFEVSREVWSAPELALEEVCSSQALQRYLAGHGFSIQTGLAGMPTAFIASAGEGWPVIGLLGEFDALPELSQSVSSEKDPIVEGGPGHGCGHNLLGAGMAGAAAAIKQLLESHGLTGTIRYYGCPAEETMYGKIKMDDEHLFDGNDACLSWHPMSMNVVSDYSFAAMTSIRFSFKGKTAHAAEAPHQGRSALDGVELMNVGTNYLREHMIPQARIHYVITDGGGRPNVVPSFAQSWYYVRAPYKNQVDDLVERLYDIAKGAALMTGTTVSHEVLSGCYNTILNTPLNDLLYECMVAIGCPDWTDEDRDFARRLQSTISDVAKMDALASFSLPHLKNELLHDCVEPPKTAPAFLAGSTDISNVSRTVPTAQIFTCCMPLGIPGHTWQVTASAGSALGEKGMLYAAKVIADAAMELYTNPELINEAKADFKKRVAE